VTVDQTRRAFLGSVVATAGIGAAGRSQAVHEAEEFNVEFDYPVDWLETYQPALTANYATRQTYEGLYGARARSEDYDEDVAVFWLRMTHQNGLPLVDADAHGRDHEPIYCYVDNGELKEVIYSEWHHSANSLTGSDLDEVLVANRADDPTHPAFRVVEEWHNFAPAPEAGDADLAYLDVEDWTAAIDTWRANGYLSTTAGEAVFDPASLRERETWWETGTMDYQLVQAFQRIAAVTGFWGGDDADL